MTGAVRTSLDAICYRYEIQLSCSLGLCVEDLSPAGGPSDRWCIIKVLASSRWCIIKVLTSSTHSLWLNIPQSMKSANYRLKPLSKINPAVIGFCHVQQWKEIAVCERSRDYQEKAAGSTLLWESPLSGSSQKTRECRKERTVFRTRAGLLRSVFV